MSEDNERAGVDDMTAQCWICPKCHDDHPEKSPCATQPALTAEQIDVIADMLDAYTKRASVFGVHNLGTAVAREAAIAAAKVKR